MQANTLINSSGDFFFIWLVKKYIKMVTTNIARNSITLTLKFINIILHSVGITVLRSLSESEKNDVHMIILLNLSITELGINVLSFLNRIVKLILATHKPGLLLQFLYILDYAVLKFGLHLIMILIAIEQICCNVRRDWFNNYKAQLSIWVIWLISDFLFIVYLILHMYIYENEPIESCKIFNNVAFILDLLFLVIALIAIFVTIYILRESYKTSIFYHSGRNGRIERQSFWSQFRHSRSFVSVLMLFVSIIFAVLPDLIFSIHICHGRMNVHHDGNCIASVLHLLSYLFHVLIFMMLKENLKKKLFGMVHNLKSILLLKGSRSEEKRSEGLEMIDSLNECQTLNETTKCVETTFF